MLFKQLPAIAGVHTVEKSVLQSILSLACITLKGKNILFSRHFPWISLEFVSTTKRTKANHLTTQGWRRKTNLGTCSDKTWRMAVERLKKLCLLSSSFFSLAEGTDSP